MMLLPEAVALDLDPVRACFAAHGYARLGRVLSDDGLAALRAAADAVMQTRGEGLFYQPDSPTGAYADLDFGRGWIGPTSAYRKIEGLERDPAFRAWIANPLFERLACAEIPGEVAIYRAVLWNKAVTGGTTLPFHQDGGRFWGIDREASLQIWTALDDGPVEAGCVEVVPGTHRAGLTGPDGGNVPPALLVDVEARVIALPTVAGESLLLHNHVWHRSGRNQTGSPRRAFTVCYMSADTRCVRKKRAPRTFFRPFPA